MRCCVLGGWVDGWVDRFTFVGFFHLVSERGVGGRTTHPPTHSPTGTAVVGDERRERVLLCWERWVGGLID